MGKLVGKKNTFVPWEPPHLVEDGFNLIDQLQGTWPLEDPWLLPRETQIGGEKKNTKTNKNMEPAATLEEELFPFQNFVFGSMLIFFGGE